MPYTETPFTFTDLPGLSQKQLDLHLKLYGGYVKNVNAIEEKIKEYKIDSAANAIALSEITRRYAFEFNGMRLHEYYFEQLGGNGMMPSAGQLIEALSATWGSPENWLTEIKAMAAMRGIGWVLTVLDNKNHQPHNIWISDHEIGHLAGCHIIFALDLWEHAFMIDYIPATKGEYVNAYLQNVNWNVVNGRIVK